MAIDRITLQVDGQGRCRYRSPTDGWRWEPGRVSICGSIAVTADGDGL